MHTHAHRFTLSEWVGLCSAVVFFAVGVWWMTPTQADLFRLGALRSDFPDYSLMEARYDGILVMLLSVALAVVSFYAHEAGTRNLKRRLVFQILGLCLASWLCIGGVIRGASAFAKPNPPTSIHVDDFGMSLYMADLRPLSAPPPVVIPSYESSVEIYILLQAGALFGIGCSLAAWVLSRTKQTC